WALRAVGEAAAVEGGYDGVVECAMVRFVAVLGVLVLFLLAGAVYFPANPNREQARTAAVLARAEKQSQGPPPLNADDAADTAVVRQLLEQRNITDEQITTLISAARPRLVRRRPAYGSAKP